MHLYITLWLSKHFHIYDCNLSRESLQGVFFLALYHVLVTSSGFRVRQIVGYDPLSAISISVTLDKLRNVFECQIPPLKNGDYSNCFRDYPHMVVCTWYSLSES